MQAEMRATSKPVDEILRYENIRLLRRYAADHNLSIETARTHFFAFKQFMAVCASKPGLKVTSTAIDNVWHSFLLFTREYRAFCDEYLVDSSITNRSRRRDPICTTRHVASRPNCSETLTPRFGRHELRPIVPAVATTDGCARRV